MSVWIFLIAQPVSVRIVKRVKRFLNWLFTKIRLFSKRIVRFDQASSKSSFVRGALEAVSFASPEVLLFRWNTFSTSPSLELFT